MTDYTELIRAQKNREASMRSRNGSLALVAVTLLEETNDLFGSVRIKRTAAWAYGMPADASTWPFVVRNIPGPPDPYEGLQVCTGADLAAKWGWARVQDAPFWPHVWVLLDRGLCPVVIDWDDPAEQDDRTTTCTGWVTVGDTRIGRLAYVISGAVA